MTQIDRLKQSWYNLEVDVRSKMERAEKRLRTAMKERIRNRDPDSLFPSMQSTRELIENAEASACASVLDLIHTAMRELELRYD